MIYVFVLLLFLFACLFVCLFVCLFFKAGRVVLSYSLYTINDALMMQKKGKNLFQKALEDQLMVQQFHNCKYGNLK